MKYKLTVRTIWEYGQRVDSQGNPHQEDSLFPAHGQQKDSDRLFILCDGMGGHEAGDHLLRYGASGLRSLRARDPGQPDHVPVYAARGHPHQHLRSPRLHLHLQGQPGRRGRRLPGGQHLRQTAELLIQQILL